MSQEISFLDIVPDTAAMIDLEEPYNPRIRLPSILAIDPGTKAMGWTLSKGMKVKHWGIVDFGTNAQTKNKTKVLTQRVAQWCRDHEEMFLKADYVLIEQQYQKGFRSQFFPMVVMQTIFGLVLYFRKHKHDTARLINSNAVKRKFGFVKGQGNAKNKAEVVARFKHLLPPDCDAKRIHDVLDCILITKYFYEKELEDPEESQEL